MPPAELLIMPVPVVSQQFLFDCKTEKEKPHTPCSYVPRQVAENDADV